MDKRVALVTRASEYVGPALARALAARGHSLVLHGAHKALVEELAQRTHVYAIDLAEVPVTGPDSLAEAAGWKRLVDGAIARFGRIDCAAIYPPSGTAAVFCSGPLLAAAPSDLTDLAGYATSTLHALQVLIPPLRATGGGQIVVFTSDAGARPEPGWSIYGAVRAGQNFLVQAAALEHAGEGISINAVGSKNVVGPGFPGAPTEGLDDRHVPSGPWSHRLESESPAGRMGTMAELAAFCMPLLDGTSRYQTAQYFSYSGGWNTAARQSGSDK
ncbi:SDR family NAD(P)-dependent oxidoreductase [Novosphingobium sp. BL-52-GroH]|uniref:SDR family NAD(P)-dependent oxidoreductase n=1 Tax=Novosphingobium sp. BL-52-GroH TaxID=3349877 RepID=UPI00384FCC48